MNITEVELKFKIIDHAMVENFTSKLKFVKREVINDVYLDTEDAVLYKKRYIYKNKKWEKTGDQV